MPTPGSRFDYLIDIMRTLRSPEGCPWDREQTLQSLRPFLLEETYEALEAIDNGDMDELREELGDLLFEVVFLARVCEEAGAFDITAAIDTVATKLVRRHPHVFGETAKAQSAEEVLRRWEELKRVERAAAGAAPKRLLQGVPKTLPGLLRAYEYGSRAATAGFDWTRTSDVLGKIREEVDEIQDAIASAAGARRIEEEIGDLLLAMASLSRKLGVEPENALRRANDKFAARFTEMERRFAERGESMKDAGLDALEREWIAVKTDDSPLADENTKTENTKS
jgi:tetrapyrrole methylase family protein/MazG family protein